MIEGVPRDAPRSVADRPAVGGRVGCTGAERGEDRQAQPFDGRAVLEARLGLADPQLARIRSLRRENVLGNRVTVASAATRALA